MEVHVPQGEGAVSGVVSGIFRKFDRIVYNAEMAYWSMIDSSVKSWQYFPTQITSLNSMLNSLSYDVVTSQVQDRSGSWREIYVQKRNTKHTQHSHCHSSSKLRPAAILAAAQSIPAGCHEIKSPVWKSPLGELRDEKGRCYFMRRGATRSSQITLRTCYHLLRCRTVSEKCVIKRFEDIHLCAIACSSVNGKGRIWPLTGS